jgi:hypothetical protein
MRLFNVVILVDIIIIINNSSATVSVGLKVLNETGKM